MNEAILNDETNRMKTAWLLWQFTSNKQNVILQGTDEIENHPQ
ncbi:MAG: hypothetical protein ACLR1G_11560 [Alistipes indistinctus]